ncbi:MAG: hypothetical protein OQK00_02215 [Rhodobacteraceae bacterium]|nr:hypothetical protein [Paracoccaceae bacterium]MCW9043329.1 hypothetical protein [Pseudopelagicola sp.]
MKLIAMSTAVLMGIASTASAQMDTANPTVMTRSAPASVVLGPNDGSIQRSDTVTVTFGKPVEVSLDPTSFPRMAALSSSDTWVQYKFGGAKGATEYDLLGR